MIKEIRNPYFADIIISVQEVAAAHGFGVLVVSSEHTYQLEKQLVELLVAKDVEGIIINPFLDDDDDPNLPHLFELKRRNIPLVVLESVRGLQASMVDVDNVDASQDAVTYLIERGQRRIVHAGAQLEDGFKARLEFFRDRITDQPTAVTCYNDLVALGLIRALRELGLRVPEDVSVIGYDHIEMASYAATPRTTVRVPKCAMGKAIGGDPDPPDRGARCGHRREDLLASRAH